MGPLLPNAILAGLCFVLQDTDIASNVLLFPDLVIDNLDDLIKY